MKNTNKNRYETPRILHDEPLQGEEEVSFNFDEFAITLARLIASKDTRTPLTIGISGPWGSGKTTLLRRVKKMLDATKCLNDPERPAILGFANGDEYTHKIFRPCQTVWFDAWKYDDEDELLVALIRVTLNTMSKGSFGEKIWSKIIDPKAPRYNVLATFLNMFQLKFGGIEIAIDLEKYKKETRFVSSAAFFDYFDEALEIILARWVHNTRDSEKINEKDGVLVVFIDDLDRCLPTKIIQVLEAIKLFLDKSGCVFVLGADSAIVQQAVIAHYKNAVLSPDSAKDYLEKIIQIRFELPPILNDSMKEYLSKEKASVDKEIVRNWQTLLAGADINPRKVKTFINDINLQWAILKNTGQARRVNRDDFTCWQILMRTASLDFRFQFYKLPDDTYDDREHRLKFILDAIKWAKGDNRLGSTFQVYSNASHLKRVLQKIEFSAGFNSEILHAFVHMMAPPPANQLLDQRVNSNEILSDSGPLQQSKKATELFSPFETKIIGGVEFIKIPAGKFVMGSRLDNQRAREDEKPQHTVDISYPYWISKYTITNRVFQIFVDGTNYVTSAEKVSQLSSAASQNQASNWRHPLGANSSIDQKLECPTVMISWDDCCHFSKWFQIVASKDIDSGWSVRLPTEAEWEKAARGEYGLEWPWGNDFASSYCNSQESQVGNVSTVGKYSPAGDSPFGLCDMSGNVWEWCHSLYYSYPYRADDGRETEKSADTRILKGGAFNQNSSMTRAAARGRGFPNSMEKNIGFRIVISPVDFSGD